MRLRLIAVAVLLSAACTTPSARFVGSGCPALRDTSPPSSRFGPNDWIELTREGCLGPCPSYAVRMLGDGSIAWKGREFVAVPGAANAQIAAADVAVLFEQARAGKFWSLCAEYPAAMTDAPSEVVAITVAGNSKRVIGNFGNQPEWLTEFARAIDTAADTHRWRHGDPKQERFLGCLDGDMGPCDQLRYDGHNPKPGITPLMRAAAKSNLPQVTALLQRGANPNEGDASGWTALMYAARSASPDTISALLHAGADAKLRSFAGQRALAAVAGAHSVEKANLLIAAGGHVRD